MKAQYVSFYLMWQRKLSVQGLGSSVLDESGYKEIHAEVISSADSRKTFDLIMSKIGVNESITSVRWSLAGS